MFHSNALYFRPFFRSVERVTFCKRPKSNQKFALRSLMPDFRHRSMIAVYARYIVRHRLFIWWETDRQTVTLKPHKVAQLRRVELTY
jgi:hypothetical protein